MFGKWTGTRLKIEKSLGRGANGEVYLVRSDQGFAAMKVCDRPQDIALEWGILTAIPYSPPFFPKPIFMDDDVDRKLYFYVMEWVSGQALDVVLKGLAIPDLYEVMRQILLGLNHLHQTGHAFCDVKAQNILVSTRPDIRVRFVDAGGVTQFGRSVRQFTPFSDRAFWGIGTRKAEPSYDVMAFAAMMTCAFANPPSDLAAWGVEQRENWLKKALKKFPEPDFSPVLERVMDGRLVQPSEVLQELERIHQRLGQKKPPHGATNRFAQKKQPAQKQPARRIQRQGRGDWTEWVMWLSLATAATVTFAALGNSMGWFG